MNDQGEPHSPKGAGAKPRPKSLADAEAELNAVLSEHSAAKLASDATSNTPGDLRHSTKKTKSFRAWAGTPDSLYRIEAHISDALERLRVFYAGRIPDGPNRQQAVAKLAEKFAFETKGNTTASEWTGSLSEILKKVDLKEFTSLSFESKYAWGFADAPKVKVKFGSYEGTVEIEIVGPDQQWVAGLYASLVGEIQKGVPSWSILRARSAGPTLGLLMSLGAFGYIYAGSSEASRTNASAVINASLVLMLFGTVIGAFVLTPMLQRAFPGFEVLGPGHEKDKGRLILGGLSAVLLFLLTVAGFFVGIAALP